MFGTNLDLSFYFQSMLRVSFVFIEILGRNSILLPETLSCLTVFLPPSSFHPDFVGCCSRLHIRKWRGVLTPTLLARRARNESRVTSNHKNQWAASGWFPLEHLIPWKFIITHTALSALDPYKRSILSGSLKTRIDFLSDEMSIVLL